MRSHRPRARWLCIAFALITLAPNALADQPGQGKKKKKASVEKCATFDQAEVEEGLTLSITSACKPTLQCSIKWAVTCAPDSKHEKTTREGAAFQLEEGQSDFAVASAAVCDGDSWSISSITWSCDPL